MSSWQLALKRFLSKYLNAPDALFAALTEHNLVSKVDYKPYEVIASIGETPDRLWLIVKGIVSITHEDQHTKQRTEGELIGEQALLLLNQPNPGPVGRTATIKAVDNVTLVSFDAALLEKFTSEQKALWFELVANVLNQKLIEATKQRAELQRELNLRLDLLNRFCNQTGLGIVRVTGDGDVALSQREIVTWFSDIAGFSRWAANQEDAFAANTLRDLLRIQENEIRLAGGETDKFMGDGLMAFWLCDTAVRKASAPQAAVQCARQVASAVSAYLAEKGIPSLSIRIGLHTGKACLGDFGTESRIAVTFIGKTINFGARYEQIRAGPDTDPDLGPVRVSVALANLLPTVDTANLKGPKEATVKGDQIEFFWT